MRTPYLCAYHVERLKACESEAFRYWGEMMRRGVQAYVECRFEAAVLYLGTALEIGLLRHRCELNGLFESLHILKPVEFLVELLKVDRQYHEVNELLEYVAKSARPGADVPLTNFLAKSFIRFEIPGRASSASAEVPVVTSSLVH